MMKVLERGLATPDFVFIYYVNFPFAELRTPWLVNLPPGATQEDIEYRKKAFHNFKVVCIRYGTSDLLYKCYKPKTG